MSRPIYNSMTNKWEYPEPKIGIGEVCGWCHKPISKLIANMFICKECFDEQTREGYNV